MTNDQEKTGEGRNTLPVKENRPLKEPTTSVGNLAALRFEILPATDFDNIPQGLRDRPQWCLAGADKRPLTVNRRPASVTDSSTWSEFAAISCVALEKGMHIGYVLSATDPYTCIDLDVKNSSNEVAPEKWTTPEQLSRFQNIVQDFDSYTERSRSGIGLHVWAEGKVGKGRRRDGVEVYSQERFIICTGDTYIRKPIANRQEVLDRMVSQMMEEQATTKLELVETVEIEADTAIWARAAGAENAGKFQQLCAGDWKGLGYPSQSEADLSLLSMLAFYSKSNEQVRRMFRKSELGKRKKAVQDDKYLNRTLAIIRARQASEDERVACAKVLSTELAKKMQATSATQGSQLGNTLDPHPQAAPASPSTPPLPWPPGAAGEVAKLIYGASMRPVPEVSIVTTLALLAGVCGKQWTIPGSGLNLYLVLLAPSGIGKEAMHDGISMFIRGVQAQCPGVINFFDFNDYASGQALHKASLLQSSFVQVSGEFGRRLKLMTAENNANMQGLRTTMTKLFSKSNQHAHVGGISYSDQEKNVATVGGVAYSMIGDSTPGTFREAITSDMMEDGFMSRLLVIEYEGDRPPENPNRLLVLPEDWATWFSGLVTQAMTLEQNNAYQPVERDSRAAEMLAAFNLECDKEINSTKDESRRQMWNRAHLKTLRISALLAVADNYVTPCVTTCHAEWAIELVRRDISVFTSRLQSGDIGNDDKAREDKVLSILKKYLTTAPSHSYKVKPALHQNHIIPRKVLTMRTNTLPAFKSHKLGATKALEQVLRSLERSGYIAKCDTSDMVKKYSEHGECYIVLELPS